MTDRTKIILDESEIPRRWYNVAPDLPAPMPPPLHPGTKQPVGPEDLAPLFPMELIRQEVTADPYVDIPEAVLDVYRLWRPTPLFRAHRLEKALNTPARIYYKYEGVSPAGSHKPNTAVPQAYYNAAEGTKRLTTETGAGQWGSALAFASAQFGLDCEVYLADPPQLVRSLPAPIRSWAFSQPRAPERFASTCPCPWPCGLLPLPRSRLQLAAAPVFKPPPPPTRMQTT